MEAVALLVGIAFAINKVTSVIKAITNGEMSTVLTQLIVWVVGFFGLLLAANSDIGETLLIPGVAEQLGTLNIASLGILALVLGSTGSFAYDLKKSIDNSDNAKETPLKIGASGST